MNIATLRSLQEENAKKFEEYGQQLNNLWAERYRCEGRDMVYAEIITMLQDDAKPLEEKAPEAPKGSSKPKEWKEKGMKNAPLK